MPGVRLHVTVATVVVNAEDAMADVVAVLEASAATEPSDQKVVQMDAAVNAANAAQSHAQNSVQSNVANSVVMAKSSASHARHGNLASNVKVAATSAHAVNAASETTSSASLRIL